MRNQAARDGPHDHRHVDPSQQTENAVLVGTRLHIDPNTQITVLASRHTDRFDLGSVPQETACPFGRLDNVLGTHGLLRASSMCRTGTPKAVKDSSPSSPAGSLSDELARSIDAENRGHVAIPPLRR